MGTRIIFLSSNNNNPKSWDSLIWANSVDPDQTLHYAVSDQGLHFLLLNPATFRQIVNWLLKFKDNNHNELMCPNI